MKKDNREEKQRSGGKMGAITRAIINVLHLFKRIEEEMRTKKIENYTKYLQETSKFLNLQYPK